MSQIVPFVCPFCGCLHWLGSQFLIVGFSRRCQQRYDRLPPAQQEALRRRAFLTN
jgi:hypothetical protein